MEMEMPSGFTEKSDRQLRQADYNHTFTEWSNYRIFGLFLGLLIVHRTQGKIIYKYDNYRTPGNTVPCPRQVTNFNWCTTMRGQAEIHDGFQKFTYLPSKCDC